MSGPGSERSVDDVGVPELVRVVVAGNEQDSRALLLDALLGSRLVKIVAVVGGGNDALAAIAAHRPDVAVLDYLMPGGDGAVISAALRRAHAATRVLLISRHTDSAAVFHGIGSGAWAVLPTVLSAEQVLTAVLDCAAGRPVDADGLTADLLAEIRFHRRTRKS